MSLTRGQVTAARKLLGWTRVKLAIESGVGNGTIVTFEKGLHVPHIGVLAALKRAFEAAGVEFMNGGQPGVRSRARESGSPNPGQQVRAARELLGWTQERLAVEVSVSSSTIGHFETGRRRPAVPTVFVIKRALEKAGVEFVEGEPGVKLRKSK